MLTIWLLFLIRASFPLVNLQFSVPITMRSLPLSVWVYWSIFTMCYQMTITNVTALLYSVHFVCGSQAVAMWLTNRSSVYYCYLFSHYTACSWLIVLTKPVRVPVITAHWFLLEHDLVCSMRNSTSLLRSFLQKLQHLLRGQCLMFYHDMTWCIQGSCIIILQLNTLDYRPFKSL